MGVVLIFIFISVFSCILSPSYGYDPLDPNGNITIKWDILKMNTETYDVQVSMFNFQLFRHIDLPGWKMNWSWRGDEVIWSMVGAEATEQGNCSRFIDKQLPHSCETQPLIVDLLPGTNLNLQVSNCCKGGVLSSMLQDESKYGAAFQMNVGIASGNDSRNITAPTFMPWHFSLGIPGYSCSEPLLVPPSKFSIDNGRRRTQAVGTWNVTCSYSEFLASPAPTCCVSLSAFYNETIVGCPKCSCGCQGLSGSKCAKSAEDLSLLRLPQNKGEEPLPVVRCSQHMCPIRVHWHVKLSYREYWRVKVTVTNLNFVKNYSQWNLVVLHPNLQSVTEVFSFKYQPLNQYGNINDTGIFYGIEHYNDMLLQSGESGNVQTELLLHKDPGIFTFREGWAFPRKISFNGHQCVMPPPDEYPRLPSSAQYGSLPVHSIIFFSIILFTVLMSSEILL